jgi:hypothetical protein
MGKVQPVGGRIHGRDIICFLFQPLSGQFQKMPLPCIVREILLNAMGGGQDLAGPG